MEKLTYPYPIPDASGHLLQMSMKSFSIDENFDLTMRVQMTFWTNDEGNFGIPLADSISLDPNLSADQKARLIKQYEPFYRTASTKGILVDPLTQLQVVPDDEGNYPEGSIEEKLIWISVAAEIVPGATVSEKVFAMMIDSMNKMVERKRI